MLKLIKIGWSFLFAILSLMIFPHERTRFILENDPAAWYGEFYLRSEVGGYVLAKNAGRHWVDPRLKDAEPLAAVKIGGDLRAAEGATRIPPESYLLLHVPDEDLQHSTRKVGDDSGLPFFANQLKIYTGAEATLDSWVILVSVILFSLIGVSTGTFFANEIEVLTSETTPNTEKSKGEKEHS